MANSFCFMSIEKIKSFNVCLGKYKHNYREIEVSNADKNKENLNQELISLNGKTYNEALNERLKELGYYNSKKIRKNAVLGFEIVTTFSKNDNLNINIEKWKEDNVNWLKENFNANKEKYGDNVLSVMYHGDEEGNVHMHSFVVPIDDKGNLNARFYVGNRKKMIELQNSYSEKMKSHNLERGVAGSKAKHTDIKKYYTALNKQLNKNLPLMNPQEKFEDYYNRINELYKDVNLKNMGLEDKYNRLELEVSQKIKNAKSESTKEFFEKYNDKLEKYDELERTYDGIENIEKKLEKISNIKKAIEYTDDNDRQNIDNLLNALNQKGNEIIQKSKKKEKEEFYR